MMLQLNDSSECDQIIRQKSQLCMIKNYKTGGLNSFNQILLECSLENLCEALASAITCEHKLVITQFGNILQDQWTFIDANDIE